MKKTLVTTVLNEEKSIHDFLNSLAKQSEFPDEVIIADGGSNDDTQQVIREFRSPFPIRLVTKTGNRSVGRNAAIEASKSEIIALTDAGTKLGRDWFKEITSPFSDSNVDAVSGLFKAEPKTFFENVSSTLMITDHDDINPDTWLPSSRSVAFRKSVWEKVGGYPEAFDHNEDTPFDKAILKAGYKFHFAPKAVVFWRPRRDLKGFLWQYFRYSRGDGEGFIDPGAYFKKVLIYLFFFYLFWLGLINPPLFLSIAIFYLFYLSKRLMRVYKKIRDWRVWPLGWLLASTVDLASIGGYLRGLLDRILERKYGKAYG